MTTTKVNQWFHGMADKEVLLEFSRLYHNCIACVIQCDNEEAIQWQKQFEEKRNSIIPYLVDRKSEFYLYNKETFDRYEKLQFAINRMYTDLQNDIWKEVQKQK